MPEKVTVGAGGADISEILVHQSDHPSLLYTQMLAQMGYPDYPTPMGVLRKIQRPTYDEAVTAQIKDAQAKKGSGSLESLLYTDDCWTVTEEEVAQG
jgi:2-oxoglutarate ferredoxin oxidoreductase subunit beta